MTAAVTVSATSLEGQALEVITALQNVERKSELNPNGSNFITGTINTDTMIFSGTFSIPVEASLSNFEGRVHYVAAPYLLDAPAEETPAEA